MKKINLIYIVLTLMSTVTFGQNNIFSIDDGHFPQDVPKGSYIKDVNNTFDKILGTWKWQEGNKLLVFKIEKVTKYFDKNYQVYLDFIKGNYSYSEDGGKTFIVNTITQNVGNNDPNVNALYSSGTVNQKIFDFTFKDIVYNKIWCKASFKFLDNSVTQVYLTLANTKVGYIEPETPPNPYFSIPDKIVLTKQ